MNKIKLSEFNIEKIKNREFEETIPELYELEKVIENNPWHNNEDVLAHTISFLEQLEKLLRDADEQLNSYLNEKVNNYSRKDCLFLAAVFHDISKKETFEEDGEFTKCPGHEKYCEEKLNNLLPRFDLSEIEKEFVVQLVKNHGVIHNILDHPNESPKEKWQKFKNENPNIYLGVAILTLADILTSYLKVTNLEEFNFRREFVNNIINNYQV